jgi:hypothetical protein
MLWQISIDDTLMKFSVILIYFVFHKSLYKKSNPKILLKSKNVIIGKIKFR